MTGKAIEFKIFSESMDTSLLKIAFKQLNYQDVTVKETAGSNFDAYEDEIAIICVKSLDEEIINSAFSYLNDNYRIIVVTDSEDIILASTLSRLGFKEIFVFPYELQKFKNYLDEVIEQSKISSVKPAGESGRTDFTTIIGSSPGVQETINLAKKVSQNHDISILILGETGTGKGLLARAIHDNSQKAKLPFVDIICTAIPSTLLESELFGFEKGAFTDAKERKIGLMELADEGTVFLDEIGDLGLDIQAKLLKALDSKVIRRLGSVSDITINARIIAATNRNLEKLVEQKLFREDLFHRLNVITIKIPPLRERGKDILLLAEHFLNKASEKFSKPYFKINPELQEFLLNYPWPGNIRELKNSIERAVLLSESNSLQINDFFNMAKNKSSVKTIRSNNIHLEIDFIENDLETIDRLYAQEVLAKFNNNKTKAAKQLGISRPKLDKLLKK
jgi:two-component system, NtrC family, response regulator AtoC